MSDEAGIQAITMQLFLAKYAGVLAGRGTASGIDKMRSSFKNKIVVLDEAGLASTEQIHGLLSLSKELKFRLMMLGDVKQLGAVETGKPFHYLQEHGLNTVSMSTIKRQQNKELLKSVVLAESAVDAEMRDSKTLISKSLEVDGSKDSDGTGSGVWFKGCRGGGLYIALGTTPTVFQAEVFAILAGAIMLKDATSMVINFLTDSQAACHALQSFSTSSRLVDECRSRIEHISEHNKVNIHWVPGHRGIRGNEIADELAKKGANNIPIGPPPFCGVPFSLAKEEIAVLEKRKLRKLWDRRGVRHSKYFLAEPHGGAVDQIRKETAGMTRAELKGTIEIITGHGGLRKHLHKMKLAPSPLCRFCEMEDETPWHLLTECQELERKRALYFGLGGVKDVLDYSCRHLLKFLRDLRLL